MKIKVLGIFILLCPELLFALKPDSVYIIRPENFALIYKEMDISTPDGYNIKTWYYPAQELINTKGDQGWFFYFSIGSLIQREYKLINKQPKPTIILCNGDADNMQGLINFVPYLVANGFNVVTFDWRGFGQSSKFPTDTSLLCYPEYLIDYNAVIDSISKMADVDANNMGVYGGSTGAYLSFAVAYTNPLVKCFAGRALMTSFDDFLPFIYKVLPDKKGVIKKPENYPENLFPVNIAPKFTKPAFLIVGKKDMRTPVKMSKKIYKNLKTNEKDKYLWIVKGAEHGGQYGPEYINFAEWQHKTLVFFDKYLKNNWW